MLKKSIVRQEGLKDCGPACLATIIKHYKGYVELEELKELCQTTKKGTTAYHLIEASKKCGFEATGMKISLEEMTQENMILPCIAHVTKYNSYYHFLVIDKIDFKKKKVIVLDPATGKETYSFLDFEKIYTGVTIQLYPISVIPNNQPYHFLSFIKDIMKHSKYQFLQIIFLSVIVTLLAIITSFYMENMVENISLPFKRLTFIFIIFLILEILKVTSDFLRNKILILMNQKVDYYLTTGSFQQIILLPYGYYRNHTTGEIVSRIHDLDAVRQVISKVAVNFIIDLPLTIAVLFIMYFISSTLFIISIILFLLYLFFFLIFHKKTATLIDTCQTQKAQTTSYMVESIEGFESIKGCNLERSILKKFESKYFTFLNKLYEFDNFYNYQYLGKEMVSSIISFLLIFVGIYLVKDNQITLGQFLTFQSLFVYFATPLRNIVDLDANIKQAKNALHKVMTMFHKNENVSILDKPFKGNIELLHLSYGQDEKPILKDITLHIKEGNKVMIVGSSGSGKSTLCRILKKYYPVDRNQVLINNIDINDYKQSDIVYVSQNEILFTDTIENIIDSDQIFEVSKLCMVDEIVNHLPLGYKTLIEEDGFNISGGEKQRLILARALARNPWSILIIDEGLNQVDVDMERKILKNIFKRYSSKTILFISHRLENRDLFDQMIQIEEGEIVFNESKNQSAS